MNNPTESQYHNYQGLYQYFNETLFKSELPNCMLNFSRKGMAVCGFFKKHAWENEEKKMIHEISINPSHLQTAPWKEVMQTLVHEMCHLWQYEFGTPSRNGYHNTEWGRKMEEVGLMPSNTSKPGGKKTGQQMADYPIQDGVFEIALKKLPQKLKLPLMSRDITVASLTLADLTVGIDGITNTPAPQKPKKNKTKYSCPKCSTNVWGKPDLNILCSDCSESFVVVA